MKSREELLSTLKEAHSKYIELGEEYNKEQAVVNDALTRVDLIIEERRAIMEQMVELEKELYENDEA